MQRVCCVFCVIRNKINFNVIQKHSKLIPSAEGISFACKLFPPCKRFSAAVLSSDVSVGACVRVLGHRLTMLSIFVMFDMEKTNSREVEINEIRMRSAIVIGAQSEMCSPGELVYFFFIFHLSTCRSNISISSIINTHTEIGNSWKPKPNGDCK